MLFSLRGRSWLGVWTGCAVLAATACAPGDSRDTAFDARPPPFACDGAAEGVDEGAEIRVLRAEAIAGRDLKGAGGGH